MYTKSDKLINFITEVMKNWRVELTAGKFLERLKSRKAFSGWDALSPSLFKYKMKSF